MTLFDIVNTRYESMLSTIYTSQYSLESLQERLSRVHETETAKAIVSRIRETCADVRLYGYDRRVDPQGRQGRPRRAQGPGGGGELGRFGGPAS